MPRGRRCCRCRRTPRRAVAGARPWTSARAAALPSITAGLRTRGAWSPATQGRTCRWPSGAAGCKTAGPWWPTLPISSRAAAESHPRHPAVVTEPPHHHVERGRLAGACRRQWPHAPRPPAGDRVAIALRNTPEFVATLLRRSCEPGMCAVPLNLGYTARGTAADGRRRRGHRDSSWPHAVGVAASFEGLGAGRSSRPERRTGRRLTVGSPPRPAPIPRTRSRWPSCCSPPAPPDARRPRC